jgi:glutamate dehydrogenase/leucine dehydrogenase
MSRTIAIAGMGWLGQPLAQKLRSLGFKVKGSVTQLDKAIWLNKNGFEAYPITISEEGVFGSIEEFFDEVNSVNLTTILGYSFSAPL